MNILDIAIAKQLAGGGGSGTDNYNELSNLPKINGTTLSGDKSSSSLGLQSEIKEGAELASDLVDDTGQDNKFVTSAEKLEWSGKQNLIDSSHKLSSDLVDDTNKTNKFVTSTEKNTWNAKQNAIDADHKLSSDLVDDTNKTNKFVTSTEKNTWNAKQNAIDSEHKLSSSLVSFTTAEAAALASGIDSAKVAQISTNQSNISLVESMNGGKNLCNVWGRSGIVTGIKVENTDIGTVRVYGTSTGSSPAAIGLHDIITLPAGNYYFYRNRQGSSVQGTSIQYFKNNTYITSINSDTAYAFTLTEASEVQFKVYFSAGQTVDAVYKPMIITKAAYDAGFTDYQPHALPNYDLTRLEAEDRASLAEVVDSGAKNLLNGTWVKTEADPITFTTNSNGSISITKSATSASACFVTMMNQSLTAGKQYAISDSLSDHTNVSAVLRDSSGSITYGNTNGTPIFTVPTTASTYKFMIRLGATYTGTITVYPMICTKAAFGVSQKFVPFGTDPFYQVPINHNMIYRGQNLGATLTDAQHTALSSGNFTDLYLGDYWTKTVTIPAGTYTGGDGGEVTVPAQTNITLKAVIADFDTFYAGYTSNYAGINTHHAAVIVTGFGNVVWNKTNSTAGGYVASLIHKWLVGSALPELERWFGSAKVLSHQKLLTNAITGDAASEWAWSSQKISLLSENQMYGSKVWGGNKATNGGYEPGEAFKHLNVFNHIDANLLFGNKNIWLRDIASAVWAAGLRDRGVAGGYAASDSGIAPAALILLS